MERITMKDIPIEERPCEKCLREGPANLSDAELLSIIIRTGSKEDNSLALSQKILALNYPKEGILGLLHLSMQELMSVKGIGRVKGAQLLCIGELSKRIWKRTARRDGTYFLCPGDIVHYFAEDIRHREQEQVFVAFLNTKGSLIRDVMISQGTVNASVVSPGRFSLRQSNIMRSALYWFITIKWGSDSKQRDIALTYRGKGSRRFNWNQAAGSYHYRR